MKIKNRRVLIFGITLISVTLACSSDQPSITGTGSKDVAVGDCDKTCLENMADRYIESLVSHDPSAVPLSDNVKFTENGVELQVGDALWATASANTGYRIYVTDPETGQVGYSGVIK